MIDLRNQTVQPDGQPAEKITAWVVWFMTSEGLFETIGEISADSEIVPVPVAVTEHYFEVAILGVVDVDAR